MAYSKADLNHPPQYEVLVSYRGGIDRGLDARLEAHMGRTNATWVGSCYIHAQPVERRHQWSLSTQEEAQIIFNDLYRLCLHHGNRSLIALMRTNDVTFEWEMLDVVLLPCAAEA